MDSICGVDEGVMVVVKLPHSSMMEDTEEYNACWFLGRDGYGRLHIASNHAVALFSPTQPRSLPEGPDEASHIRLP